MKDCPGGSYLVLKSTPIFTGEIPLLAIGYKYNSRKVLRFISTEGSGSTEPGDPYLSRFPDIYLNVSVRPVVLPHFLGRYLNACNAIENHNMMQQSDLSLEKYWVTQSGYFRLATTVAWIWVLPMGSFYTVMVLQRETRKRKFQHWSTTIGQFMTVSIIHLQLIVGAQICIYPPSPLMINLPPAQESLICPRSAPSCHICCL